MQVSSLPKIGRSAASQGHREGAKECFCDGGGNGANASIEKESSGATAVAAAAASAGKNRRGHSKWRDQCASHNAAGLVPAKDEQRQRRSSASGGPEAKALPYL